MKKFLYVTLLFAPLLAYAALGDNVTTVNHVSKQVSSAVIVEHNNYYVRQYVTFSGSLVKEYYANNVVFAISWHGAKKENLHYILGKYFTSYVNSHASVTNSSSYVNNGDLIVSSGGYPNKFYGKAYIQSSMPSSFNINDLDK